MATINNDFISRPLCFDVNNFNDFKVGAIEQAANYMNY
jgi:hypothetical protein